MRRNYKLVHKLFTPVSSGVGRKESDACIPTTVSPIDETAARASIVFFGSLGTSVSPLLEKRLPESTPLRRDQPHTYLLPRPFRKPRSPIPEKTSARPAFLREAPCPHQRLLRVRR